MFSACAVRQAAMVMSRSASRERLPETEVNAPANPGSQPITSSSTSGRSTRGSIALTRLRRSIRLPGSGIALIRSTCSRPSASTLTASLSENRPATPR